MNYPKFVRVVEVGPRDGLQNEAISVSIETKIRLIEQLAAAGMTHVECGSFVSPQWVHQMADSADVLKKITRKKGVIYSALVPNIKGLYAALESNIDEIAVFGAASETFSQKNINSSIDDSLQRFVPVIEKARAQGIAVRGYVSCALGCPYEGQVPPEKVVAVAKALYQMGCYEVSLGDTIGIGTPLKVQLLLEQVLHELPLSAVAVHFHDTYGQAIANIFASLQMGISTVDSSVGGLGGCPYAKGASGNVATEDLLYLLHGMNIQTGIDLFAVAAIGREITQILGGISRSKVGIALSN